MLTVNLYNGYAADRRLSMKVYADSLRGALSSSSFRLNYIHGESSLERFERNRWLMRYLRYAALPRQIVQAPNAHVHHVLDHGYAHLFSKLGAGAKCVSVHDLIPLLSHLRLIEGSNNDTSRNPILNRYSLSFVTRYDKVIAISENTKADLVSKLNIDSTKITVIPPVISTRFAPCSTEDVHTFAKNYGLDQDKRWLMISGVEFYKNHATSLHVLKDLRQHSDIDVHLLRTGSPSPSFSRLVKQFGLQSCVTELYLDSIDDMPLAYSFADCLLFPSLYEGFGMPVVEALACGTPVVASDRGALPELCPNLVLHEDALDTENLAKAVFRVLSEPKLTEAVASNAVFELEKFRPMSVKHKWLEFYTDLIEATDCG